ncbi:hypothetical protein F9B85_11905 [Heliorestis acidaminivorans]|uniref:IstB-like ATP-binding domain-containing protein n=1 Tax=Heliorestis acidaminivorans TaxID=553427 RepID=A0A6I0EXX7_9FIRM|nr:ATP-binding protein [Heliorestis acidaminivorans]KAB2951506.1 hypothetical protein F9B85_11905 [Heliorestis acidaminivorans]
MNQMTTSHYLKELRLPAAAKALPNLLREAQDRDFNHLEFLSALLRQELDQREENMVARRIKQARFPQIKTLETFDFSLISTVSKSRILALAQGQYINEKRHVIFMGNSGTGNYRKYLVMERNERISRYIKDCTLISFDNTSE